MEFSELAYEIFSNGIENDTEEFNEVRQLARAYNNEMGNNRYRYINGMRFKPTGDIHQELLNRISDNLAQDKGSGRVGSGRIYETENDVLYLPSEAKRARARKKAYSRDRYMDMHGSSSIHSPKYSQYVAKGVAERKAAKTEKMQEDIKRKKAKAGANDRLNSIIDKLAALDKKK